MTLKQIFCKHIWKQIKYELIDTGTAYLGGDHNYPMYTINTIALTHECLKCGKQRLEKQEEKLPIKGTTYHYMDYYK